MMRLRLVRSLLVALVAVGLVGGPALAADVSSPFAGKAVNGGTVTHEMQGDKHTLRVSADFKVPGSPDPHWQVVDTTGTVYRLSRLTLKDDKVNKSITVPAYVPDIAKVQMWCAWAEVLLGEASFDKPVVVQMMK